MKEGITLSKLFAGNTLHDVVHGYSDMLLRIAFQNTKVLADAEDIVQEVYIKLINYEGTFTSEEHLKAWLIKVTINKCKDHFKSAWYRKAVPLTESMDILAPEEQKIMEEIFQLKKEDRNILYLYYYEGYTIREIADMLGKKQNTISTKLQRAKKKLRCIVEEEK